MDMALREALNAMPYEYRDRSLEYNLLKQHISLYSNGACQCSVKRKIEEACSPFGSLEAAAVLCSFRGLPAPYGPCSYCGRPEQGGPEQGRPKRLDLQLQTFGFKSLLSKELKKINDFFNLLHRQYIGRIMKELDAWRSQEESRQNRLHSEDRELGIDPEIGPEKIRQCMKTTAAKIDLLASYCILNRTAFIEILKQHDKETGSDIYSDFSGRLQEMDFVRYERDVKQDEKYCLSLLKSSTGSSSLVAADPAAPQMSDRGRNLLRLHQEERVQLLSSSDGSFDYIKAAKVAKDAIAVWSPTV